MNELIGKITETGTVTIPTEEYWNLLRDQRDLEILHKAYDKTVYGTLDREVAEAIFGPKCVPKPEPEPVPDPAVVLAKVTSATEKVQRAIEQIEAKLAQTEKVSQDA